MSIAKTFISLLITSALLVLLFWGLSKFVLWFPTLNSIIFYFLTFIFAYVAVRMFTTTLQAIPPVRRLIKTTGLPASHIFKVVVIVILLAVCLFYFGQIVLEHNNAYIGLQVVGLVAFCLFIVLCSFNLLVQIISPV